MNESYIVEIVNMNTYNRLRVEEYPNFFLKIEYFCDYLVIEQCNYLNFFFYISYYYTQVVEV